jgi:hypothetical protein
MIKGLICPDSKRVMTGECLTCQSRCCTKSYALEVTKNREWKGIPSVTQLLNGTLESYLKLTTDYYVSPDSMAFAISGTMKHSQLEENATDQAEERLIYKGISGQPDEIEGDTLIDYKTAGSYKVSQCLGIGTEKISDGYYKNGKEKFKTVKVFKEPDFGDYTLQLNMYRIMIGNVKQISIKNMKIFFIVRDGGTTIAKSRGIDKNIYFVDVPFMDDATAERFFMQKKELLLEAMATETQPGICSQEERWFGRKCVDYCEVREYCKYSNQNNNEGVNYNE